MLPAQNILAQFQKWVNDKKSGRLERLSEAIAKEEAKILSPAEAQKLEGMKLAKRYIVVMEGNPDTWVVTDKDGEVVDSGFESQAAANRFIKEQDAPKGTYQISRPPINDSMGRLEDVSEINSDLEQVIQEGRTARQEGAAERSAMHNRQKEELMVDITEEEYKTPTTEAEKKEMAKKDNERANKIRKKNKKTWVRAVRFITNFWKRHESLADLVDIISKEMGDMLGGVAQRLIVQPLRRASYNYKREMLAFQKELEENLTEFFGKDYQDVMLDNRIPKKVKIKRQMDEQQMKLEEKNLKDELTKELDAIEKNKSPPTFKK